jgi:hypothetical protein
MLVAVLQVWLPEFRAHWASPLPVPAALVERSLATTPLLPLRDLAAQRLGLPVRIDADAGPRAAVSAADELLAGRVRFPRQPASTVEVPFVARNLVSGPPTHQLYVASLATAEILIDAWHATGEARYLEAARAELTAFARTDRWRLLPSGMLWNDHALAATIPVLIDYWDVLRTRAEPDLAHASEVLALVRRTAQRLARPQVYTFRTNHGLMQSLALLQVAAAFPALPEAASLRATGCERVAELVAYYLSPEGPVLEHSALYHVFGVALLRIADTLTARHGCPVAPDFDARLRAAERFAARLRYPDGSLPVYGNTDHADRIDHVRTDGGPLDDVLPASGLALWHDDGTDARTLVTWGHFPSRAHKLADDMSVVVWAGGRRWITTTGYWPYGLEGEVDAHGWRGSNAPHLPGEPPEGDRTVRLVGSAASDSVRVITLARSVVGGPGRIERTVVRVEGRRWYVVDATTPDAAAGHSTVWTFPPNLRPDGVDGDFVLHADDSGATARFALSGELARPVERVAGGRRPFAGWTVHDGRPTPSPSFVATTRGPGSVALASLDTSPSGVQEPATPSRLDVGARAGHWSIRTDPASGVTRLALDADRFDVEFSDGRRETLVLRPEPAAAADARASVLAAYAGAQARHERFPYLLPWRIEATLIFAGLLVVQEGALWAIRRRRPRAALVLRIASVPSWLLLGAWTAHVHLVR